MNPVGVLFLFSRFYKKLLEFGPSIYQGPHAPKFGVYLNSQYLEIRASLSE